MDQLMNGFIKVREELIEVLNEFPKQKVDEVLFGDWSLKSVLAHLIGWDEYFTHILRSLKLGEEPPHWGSISKFNQSSVDQRKDSSWEEVYEEFVSAGDEFIQEYSQLSGEIADSRFWKKKSYTPTKILEVNIHHYEKTHLPEIKSVLITLQTE